jgi:hypothetical protein
VDCSLHKDAVVGGTISMIGGGKFANGAQTGAFRYLFNEWTHGPKQQYECMGRCLWLSFAIVW